MTYLRTRRLAPTLSVIALCMAISSAAASPVVDQQATDFSVTGYLGGGWQQSVTVSVTGQLVGLEIYLRGSGSGSVSLFSGEPWQGGAALGSGALTSDAGGWTYINLSTENLFFEAGEIFSFAPSVSADLNGSGFGTGAYAGGMAVFNLDGSLFYTDGEHDLAFRTYVEAVAVPEPGALALLGIGLACLAATRRRK